MQIDVLFFGILKDVTGVTQQKLVLNAGATVEQMLEQLRADRSGAVWASLAVAVNREYAGVATVLEDGDEVALLPPVSGGRV